MKVEVRLLTNWGLVRDAARTTMWKLPDGVEPSDEWKRKILVARHSPIESLIFEVKMLEIPYWVSVHLVRHKFGITHYVSSQRDDRHINEKPRAELPQGALVNHSMVLNAQALIAVSKKRLCLLASKETREVWQAVVDEIKKIEPCVAFVLRPECEWCGDHCPEMRGCGRKKSLYDSWALRKVSCD